MKRALVVGMTGLDKRLLRHLTIAVLIKLVVLGVLWSLFIRDGRVGVDADAIGERLGTTVPTQGESK
ncbi:cytochrome oxidase putative small subunit CydP [Massilia eurypsychrophila]|jgi:hypothetical protein|uniref:cytochrome oxidase putative small subunit CydP n=1 Tax=Massilia eurypsychrophila TaxID=1485217 RepID=UPI001034EA54|nr:cytochrome oxidase putative small subunit CydP [Massilia eurypsychrophila]